MKKKLENILIKNKGFKTLQKGEIIEKTSVNLK